MTDPDSNETASRRLRREMSISHREFFRSLEPAIKPATYTVEGRTITVHGAPGRVEIRLSEERERRIALLRLPVTDVEIDLDGFTEASLTAFLGQFDLAFQRGGG